MESRRARASQQPRLRLARVLLVAPRLVEALETGDYRSCVERVCEGVYAFDLFSQAFTNALLAEVDYFYASKLPAARPNSMNNCADSVSKP